MTRNKKNTTVQDTPPPLFLSSDRYLNRELSWLAFNERVMSESKDTKYPLLERIRFLSISAANLDEFYTVRVAGLINIIQENIKKISIDNLTPQQQLIKIHTKTHHIIHKQQQIWQELRTSLENQSIFIVSTYNLPKADLEFLYKEFQEKIFPILTPITLDPSHPFPFIPNQGFAVVFKLRNCKTNDIVKTLIALPTQLPRFWKLNETEETQNIIRYVTLEDIISLHFDVLFPNFSELGQGYFKILRDSDIDIEEEAEDLVREFESALEKRRQGQVIRLKITASTPPDLIEHICDELEVDFNLVIKISGLLGLSSLKELITDDRRDLQFPVYLPRYPERIRECGGDVFAAIRTKDFIVHHPYESFDVVVDFLKQAAIDPQVVAIKQMLYRTSNNSPIIKALIDAAHNGKTVTALVELKARFDEEANIKWSKDLEKAGVNVVFGFLNLKTHAKISVVIRRENNNLKTYSHFGTGNYHLQTAKIYTDLSLFTADEALGRDAIRLFNYTTSYVEPSNLEKLIIAPVNLKTHLLDCIEQEITFAKQGKPATIWAKMNSLVHKEIIDALYNASNAGVKIKLIVRGICCLKAGVTGLSENIEVRSIIGRFLEHHRIICFGHGETMPSPHAKVYISSADWMPRNLERRVETLVPIENPTVHRQILDYVMVANLADTEQSWLMQPDSDYKLLRDNPHIQNHFNVHNYFMTNPSLSGRGHALEENPPSQIKRDLLR